MILYEQMTNIEMNHAIRLLLNNKHCLQAMMIVPVLGIVGFTGCPASSVQPRDSRKTGWPPTPNGSNRNSAFVSRGVVHTFQNFTETTARMLVMVTPGGFNQFFEELSSVNKGLPFPDLARTEELMNSYGLDLLGPPLS
jgi:hypothetical protein